MDQKPLFYPEFSGRLDSARSGHSKALKVCEDALDNVNRTVEHRDIPESSPETYDEWKYQPHCIRRNTLGNANSTNIQAVRKPLVLNQRSLVADRDENRRCHNEQPDRIYG